MGLWLFSQKRETLIYGLVIILGILGGYIRLLWIGLAPVNVWDTTALILTSYILLICHRLFAITSLYRLTLLIPFLALFTVPIQLNSIHASGALLAAGTLYLLMQPPSKQSLPTYLGLLALNIGIYLWIPNLAQQYDLVWIYTVPAATTVLLMLQLHTLELKPSVINTIRLFALCTLYVSATIDIFLRPELTIFLLALGLSLGGILLGIALRVRVFLYTGTIFLILNILWQLYQLYPEGRLMNAIVLISLGIFIIAGMIWFNIQREAIMQRVRIVRADLANWE